MSIITAQAAFDMVRDPDCELANLEDVRVSEHFAWSEVFANRVMAEVRAAGMTAFKTAEKFSPKLELVRDHLRNDLAANAVMISGSWFRSAKANSAAGGAPASRHLVAGALDFHVPGFEGLAGNRAVQASLLKVKKRIGICVEITGGSWTHADDRIAAFAFWGKAKGYKVLTPAEEQEFIRKYGR